MCLLQNSFLQSGFIYSTARILVTVWQNSLYWVNSPANNNYKLWTNISLCLFLFIHITKCRQKLQLILYFQEWKHTE